MMDNVGRDFHNVVTGLLESYRICNTFCGCLHYSNVCGLEQGHIDSYLND